MTTDVRAHEVRDLLAVSAGLPIIEIVLDVAHDRTSIRCAGLEGAAVPRVLLALGRALTAEE